MSFIQTAYKFITDNTEGNSFLAAIKILSDYTCTIIEQTFRQSVTKKGKFYLVKYIINGRMYEIEVCPVTGPRATTLTPKELGFLSCKHLFTDYVLNNIG